MSTETTADAPAVSICIPTYNRPLDLRAALDSCIAQSFQDFEIVVSDNGSTDESQRVVEAMRDPRIRYFRNEANVGGLRNLDLAIGRARGRYVKLLMDDDLLKPHALEVMVAAFERHPSAGVVMAPLDIVDAAGRQTHRRFYLIRKMSHLYRYLDHSALVPGRTVLKDFMTRLYPCCVPSGVLYRRECFERLGGLDLTMSFAVDVDICARFATAYDFYYVDDVLASWRFSPGSDTVNLHRKGLPVLEFYYLARKYADDPAVMALFPEAERAGLRRDAYFFATKRCVLAILAGLRGGNTRMILDTIGVMWREDPYKLNFLRLPFNLAAEMLRAAGSWLR